LVHAKSIVGEMPSLLRGEIMMSKCFRSLLQSASFAAVFVFGAGAASAQTLAYVSDAFGAVHVLDTATNTVVASVPVGGQPGHLAATPNGAFVYVADSLNNNVSVIAVSTNTVVATVAVAQPQRIAFTPNGTFAYVTSTGLNRNNVAELYVIDTARNKVVATIPLDQGLDGVAVTPDGASVWVASAETNSVYVVDTATNTLAATIFVGDDLRGLAITPDGAFVYTTSAASATVSVISTTTHTVVATIPGLIAFDIAITPNGAFAYVPLVFNDVAVIDTATNTVAATVTPGGNPAFVAITPDGAFAYVADLDGQVRVIDTASNTVTDNPPVGISLTGITILIKPASPTTKEQCTNGGWATFNNPSFANQGGCISYVNKL
jgi:YVTN family beta-propeller protein